METFVAHRASSHWAASCSSQSHQHHHQHLLGPHGLASAPVACPIVRGPHRPGAARAAEAARPPNRHRTVASALFSPPAFQPDKLTVYYIASDGSCTEEERASSCVAARTSSPSNSTPGRLQRRYTLTHNDLTGALKLTIGEQFNHAQISGFYTRLLRDEVVAEWRTCGTSGRPSLHVYCHVSGEERWLAPPQLRDYIFRRELPLVLDTFLYADRELLQQQPNLADAEVYVHFQSCKQELDTVELWGVLGQRNTWQPVPRGWLQRFLEPVFGATSSTSQQQQQQERRQQASEVLSGEPTLLLPPQQDGVGDWGAARLASASAAGSTSVMSAAVSGTVPCTCSGATTPVQEQQQQQQLAAASVACQCGVLDAQSAAAGGGQVPLLLVPQQQQQQQVLAPSEAALVSAGGNGFGAAEPEQQQQQWRRRRGQQQVQVLQPPLESQALNGDGGAWPPQQQQQQQQGGGLSAADGVQDGSRAPAPLPRRVLVQGADDEQLASAQLPMPASQPPSAPTVLSPNGNGSSNGNGSNGSRGSSSNGTGSAAARQGQVWQAPVSVGALGAVMEATQDLVAAEACSPAALDRLAAVAVPVPVPVMPLGGVVGAAAVPSAGRLVTPRGR